MPEFWKAPLLLLAALLFLTLLLWSLFGAITALVIFSIALLVWLYHQLKNLASLQQWLLNPSAATVPAGAGIWVAVFSDLARFVRTMSHSEQKLTYALERFQQAGSALPEGMVILDEADRIEWCNVRAELHFGIGQQRDVGQQMSYLVRQPSFVEYLKAQNFSEPLRLKVTHNEDMILSVQLVPYGDKQKLVISRDITRWERLETMRRDFVANVSHELRTPLTVIGGFLESLADMHIRDIEHPVELMREQTARMQRLVEELLMLSRLESGQNVLHEDHIDIHDLIKSLYQEALNISAGKHQITLNIEFEDGLLGSKDEIRSAFSNLISNAVRYTPQGGKITLYWRKHPDGAAFIVEDDGIGIEAQHISRLTERFYRVDRSRSRETGGTGLGLAIVKHVLNRHQARLEIFSEVGRGSLFSAIFAKHRLLKSKANIK